MAIAVNAGSNDTQPGMTRSSAEPVSAPAAKSSMTRPLPLTASSTSVALPESSAMAE
jgi:hypothetical protein